MEPTDKTDRPNTRLEVIESDRDKHRRNTAQLMIAIGAMLSVDSSRQSFFPFDIAKPVDMHHWKSTPKKSRKKGK